MALFYVTGLEFFSVMEVRGWFCGFAGFLKGVLGKEGVSVWFFDGGFVVDCVVDMDAKQRSFGRLKMRHDS
jgi:hypothetical protein